MLVNTERHVDVSEVLTHKGDESFSEQSLIVVTRQNLSIRLFLVSFAGKTELFKIHFL